MKAGARLSISWSNIQRNSSRAQRDDSTGWVKTRYLDISRNDWRPFRSIKKNIPTRHAYT